MYVTIVFGVHSGSPRVVSFTICLDHDWMVCVLCEYHTTYCISNWHMLEACPILEANTQCMQNPSCVRIIAYMSDDLCRKLETFPWFGKGWQTIRGAKYLELIKWKKSTKWPGGAVAPKVQQLQYLPWRPWLGSLSTKDNQQFLTQLQVILPVYMWLTSCNWLLHTRT